MEEKIKILYKKVNDSCISKDYDITIDNTVLTNKDIVYGTFELQEKLSSLSSFQIGESNARMLKVQVAAELGNIVGKKMIINQTINRDLISGKVGLGAFYVDSAVLTANKRYRDIVAYDNIYLFNKDVSSWYESLSFPIKMYDFLISLCEYIGITCSNERDDFCNANMLVEKTISAEEIKGITVLKCIAELNGGFFRASANEIDSIEFLTLSNDIAETVEVQLYSTIKKEDYVTEKITGINIRSENDDIGASVGTAENAYVIQDNFLVYGKNSNDLANIASNIYPVIKDIQYIPYTATQVGLPYLRCGSRIKYILKDGSSFESYILQRVLTGTQILKDDITTLGTKTTEKTVGIAKEIIKLKGKVNIFKRALEETISQIENIESSFKSQFKQTENEISNIVAKIATVGSYGLIGFKPLFSIGRDETHKPEDIEYMEDYDYLNLSTDYLWIKFVSAYKNGTIISSEPFLIYKAIINSITYYISSSKVEPAGGEWTDVLNIGDWEKDKYIWVKILYTSQLDGMEQEEILWCDTSVDTPIDIQALLDIKIDKDELVSEINASADIIRLIANRLIIDSDNFKLSQDGNIEAKSGKIGGWEISNKLSSVNENAFINPGYKEWDIVRKSILGTDQLTDNQKKVSDLTNDGKIDIEDALNIRMIVEGQKTIDDIIKQSGYTPRLSTLNVEINPQDPKKVVRVYGKNSWDREIDYYFGLDGVKTGIVSSDCVTADIVKTTSGVDLDELNSNLDNYLLLAGGTVENLKVSGSLNAALWKGAGGRGLIDAITVTISGTISASATGTLSGTFNIPNGYSSVGIIGYNLATYSLSPVTVKVAGNTVTIAVRNLTTSSVKVSSANVTVLLLKNAA